MHFTVSPWGLANIMKNKRVTWSSICLICTMILFYKPYSEIFITDKSGNLNDGNDYLKLHQICAYFHTKVKFQGALQTLCSPGHQDKQRLQ